MSTSGDDPGGFFRGFRQSRIADALACLLLGGGVVLVLVGALIPTEAPWARWMPLIGSGIIVTSLLLLLFRPPRSRARGAKSELEKAKQQRYAAIAIACASLADVALFGFTAARSWYIAASMNRWPGPPASAPAALRSLQREQPRSGTPPAAMCGVWLAVGGMAWLHARRMRTKIRRLEGRCEKCNYDLRGLPEPRCPECGTPFTPPGPDK